MLVLGTVVVLALPPSLRRAPPTRKILQQASDDLQNAALGLFDAQLQTRFGLSEVQLQTLRLVGATGAQGAFQNQLAASVGSENRNFYYVIRVGSVVGRTVARLQVRPAGPCAASWPMTLLLPLPRCRISRIGGS